MKILLANKFYYRRGGDCIYVLNLEQLLKEKGHEVAIFAMQHPDNIATPWSKYFPSEVKFTHGTGIIEVFLRPFGSKEVKSKFNHILNDFNPDIVHVNNIHSQLSPIIAEIAHNKGIKVIWTLHDYKLLCPRYDCLRNNTQICEACFANKRRVLEYNCMKNSRLASFLAYQEAQKWSKNRLLSATDTFICPSHFMMNKMVQGGFPLDKISHLCNFIDIKKTKKEEYQKEEYYCFIGRLSHEKGVETLLKAAQSLPYHLKIIGDGPLKEKLKLDTDQSKIEFLGHKPWPEIKEIVGKARFSVIPSEWYENNPLSVIEAQCLGTPVLGAKIGGIPELIDENMNGSLFESGNILDLQNKIEYCWNEFPTKIDYEKMAMTAQQKYDSESYYNKLMKIYQDK